MPWRREFLACLSLGNLFFIDVWVKLTSSCGYLWKAPPVPAQLVAVVLNISLLAVLLWVALTLGRRTEKRFLLYGSISLWVFALAVALNAIRRQFVRVQDLALLAGGTGLVLVVLALLLVGVSLCLRWRHRITMAILGALLVLFPLFPMKVMEAGWVFSTKYRAVAFRDNEQVRALKAAKGPDGRVLCLVFDEMDQRLTFLDRAPMVDLIEIDRFRAQSIFATNAYPPAGDTLRSMPALIMGKLLAEARPVRPNELMVRFAGTSHAVGWSSQSNLFSTARSEGFNTALAGWGHPYCRVIGGSLTACGWYSGLRDEQRPTLAKAMLSQALSTIPLARYYSRRLREEQISIYLGIQELAMKWVADRNFGLILIHWPIPHPPGIYDRRNGNFSLDRNRDYWDNLLLVDRTIGEIRRAMEAAGVWDGTSVLITSDHWLRFGTTKLLPSNSRTDHRIPFLLKLAGQHRERLYDRPFNTILFHDLCLALLRGELRSPDEVIYWIDTRASFGESPYTLSDP